MSYCEEYRTQLLKVIEGVDISKIEQATEWMRQAREENRQIFTCGNGGSASTASHFVTDMVKGASYGRSRRFKIHALTDSLSTLTAYANDVAFDCVFVEQLKNFASPGDLLLCISGSGNSPDVIEAAKYAREAGCRVIALTGRDGGKLAPLADINIGTGHQHMGRIEDLHLIVCHMMCYTFMDTEK
ncbi:MAG: SIS domain-containing protein [Terracidiphilus sp.]